MKTLALFVVTLSSMAFGTSIRSVALESVETPMWLHSENQKAKIIRVAADSEVFGGVCGVIGSGREGIRPVRIDYSKCEWKTMKHFSRAEMTRIMSLVEAARHGVIRHPDPREPRCLALPTHSLKMTADNGMVLLQAGSYPCGGHSYNQSTAARELVKLLNELRAELNQIEE